uniref:Vitellogenin 3, phosvitinless n=1 Tax=Cyclopterus lumpus TaxID=8103 RepID=A0A8C3A5Q8_CYCLU
MKGLILCCLVALASNDISCWKLLPELGLNPNKTYEYKYVGTVNFGLGIPNLAQSGTRMSCKIKIRGVSEQTFVLQVSDFSSEEFNGVEGKNEFEVSAKLTERIASQLVKPFMFDYVAGHVDNIRSSAEISDTIVNIVRGMLGSFQLTVKITQRIYELEEAGIHGKCQSSYATEINAETNDMTITQVVDVNNCREKAAIYKGLATAVLDPVSRQRGESVVSTVRSVYTVKPTVEGGLITMAHGLEQQNFNKGISAHIMSAYPQCLTAIKIICYLIKHLAEANRYQIDTTTSEDTIKLYQLLRVIPYEGLDVLWKQFAGNEENRRWFLDMIVEVNDARILKFLETRFQTGDLSANEALQTLLLAFDHLQAVPDLVEMAKMFLTMPFSKSNVYLWQTVVLSYGSLVYKHCAYYTPCPVAAVQPLLDMARESLSNGNHTDMVIALKALGNAGHPGSIKTIMRFLPGVAATPVDLPPRVLSAAVQSMRLIAARDPQIVQEITMSLFLQKKLATELRMLAFMILFDTKPSMALVSIVTVHLQEEKDLHVISFAYSYLKSFSRSSTPNNHFLSTACNVAVKILAPRFGRLSYHYSKAMRMDWFNDDFLIGTATEVFMLKSATNIFPTEIMMKGKFYFIGRILQLLELGIHAEGLVELLGNGIPGFKGDLSFSDFQAVLNVLKNWEVLPNDKPIMTAYSRVSGQEWFYADLKKETIDALIKSVSLSAGKGSSLWVVIESLQRGVSWHWTKPYLIVEVRYFQATILGLPLEISKYYESISGITVNAKATTNPPLNGQLGQLLTSDISLETDGFIGFTKDFWVYYGINTELFQCGSEFKAKTPLSIPWKFTVKINIAEKKFELDFPSFQKFLFSFPTNSSNVYAVTRNIEEPELAKMTPIIPNPIDSNAEVVHSGPTAVKPDSDQVQSKTFDNMCAESNIYGVGLCVESEFRREYYHDEYPLYYFLGYTHMAFKVVPVQSIKPVDKIHFEVNASPSGHPVSTRQLLETLRRLSMVFGYPWNVIICAPDWNSTPEAVFNVNFFAMNGNQKPEGYDAVFYYTPKPSKSTQLIVSQVGENINWKMCINTTVKPHVEAMANIRWGAECQTYGMSITSENARFPGAKPKINVLFYFFFSIFFISPRFESYIPGIALLLDFYQKHEKNVKQEISASLVATSADSIDVTIKFPEYTVYRQAIPFPLPPATSTSFNGTSETQQ